MFDLGGLTGMRGSIAYAINSSGTIVGSAYSSEDLPRAVLWDESGLHDLGTLSGGERSYSDAKGISDDGTVVGGSHDLSQHEAFVWVDGTMYGLTERSYEASAINSRGEIVGSGTCGAVIATPR
jgi:probable HAF family extracellular repeat protein